MGADFKCLSQLAGILGFGTLLPAAIEIAYIASICANPFER
jgi:hypothetical protein